MSEAVSEAMQLVPLALSEQGDSFDLPEETTSWRIKYFKNGSRRPELLREHNGLPVQIPVSAAPDDLMQVVGGMRGRFRLEPVNALGRLVNKELCAIIVLGEDPTQKAAPHDDGPTDSRDKLLAEVTKSQNMLIATVLEQNQQTMADNNKLLTDLATQQQLFMTTMAEKFGNYVDSTAKLLGRAPQEPVPATAQSKPPRNAFDALDDLKKMQDFVQENFMPEDEEDYSGEESASTLALDRLEKVITPLLIQTQPVLQHWVHTRIGISPEQSRKLLGVHVEDEGNTGTKDDGADQQDRVIDDDKIAAILTHLTPDESARFKTLFKDPEFDTIVYDVHLLPTQDAVAQVKILIAQQAIEQHLTPKERTQCRAMLANLPPKQVVKLQQQLLTLSTDEVVAKIRAVLPKI